MRAASFSLGLSLIGCSSSSSPTPKFTDDGLADCPPTLPTLEANQCAGVFRQYHLQCTGSTLPVLGSPKSVEPMLRFFDCLWSDKLNLQSGLDGLTEYFEDSAQETILAQYPALLLSRKMKSQPPKPNPTEDDLPLSEQTYVYEGWRYLWRSEAVTPVRWHLEASTPEKTMESWDRTTKQWVKGAACMKAPVELDAPLPEPPPDLPPDPVPITVKEPTKAAPKLPDTVAPCETTIEAGQNDWENKNYHIKTIEMGSHQGTFQVEYYMARIPDYISVWYEGVELWKSGCVSLGGKSPKITLNGQSTQITLKVIPLCDNDRVTIWRYKVSCPK